MNSSESSERLPTLPLSNYFLEKLDKVDSKTTEVFGYSVEFNRLIQERPDLAFKTVILYLIAFFTLPSEVLLTYSAAMVKGVLSTAQNALKNNTADGESKPGK